MLRVTCLGFSFVFLLCSLQAQSLPQEAEENKDAVLLARIVDEFWQDAKKTGMYRDLIDSEPVNELPDISENKAKAEAEFARHIVQELRAVNLDKLNHQDWLTLRILNWETWHISEQAKCH